MKVVNDPDVLMKPGEVARLFDVETKTLVQVGQKTRSTPPWSGPWAGTGDTFGQRSWRCAMRKSPSDAGPADLHMTAHCGP